MTDEPQFYRLTISPAGFSAEPFERSTEPYYNAGAVHSLRISQERSTEPFTVIIDWIAWEQLSGKEKTR